MILSDKSIEAIRQSKKLRFAIGLALNFSEEWVMNRVSQNKNNGLLTTYAVLKLIQKNTGVEEIEDLLVITEGDVVSTV